MSIPRPYPAAMAPVWQPRGLAAWALLNALAGLAYWGSAQLGLLAAIGPAQASLLWPPAGVMLAALLLWGVRVVPGLLAGSLLPLLNTGGWDAELGTALLLRLAGLAQCALIYWLLDDWPGRLQAHAPRLAGRFAGAVLGCGLLTPTVAMLLLGQSGELPFDSLGSTWLIWWVGDVAGMLVVAPPLMVLLHRGLRQHLVHDQTFPTLTLGLGLTLAGSALLAHLEQGHQQRRASTETAALAQSLRQLVELTEADTARLAALHRRAALPAEDFDTEAAALRRSHDWLAGLAYLRRVPAAERPGFEAGIEQNLRSLRADGSLARAPAATEHWAVQRLSPVGGQEARLGVDEASDPLRWAALQRTLQTGEAAWTVVLDSPLFALDADWGLLVYQAVREGEAAPVGAVSAAVQLRRLAQAALAAATPPERDTLLLVADEATARALYIHRDGRVDALGEAATRNWLRQVPPSQRVQAPLQLGVQRWLLVQQAPAWPGGWPPLAALAAGLACTLLLTALQVARARRDRVLGAFREQLERQVQARTTELAEREALLRTLLRHIPDPVWLKDTEGRLLVVNAAAEALLGQPAEALLGRRLADCWAADLASADAAADARALQQGGASQQEAELRDAAGRLRRHGQIRVAVRDAEGRSIGLLGLSWDITEAHQRERALQRFRWLADSAAQGFVLARLDGQVVYLNAAASRWLDAGRPWDEAMPQPARRFYGRRSWLKLQREVLPCLLGQRGGKGGSWSGLLPPNDASGHPLPQLLSNFFLLRDAQGQAHYLALLLTDLSERLQLEDALAQARDRAEQANRAKSAFLSNISHEIRTPLNAVIGYAQLLNEDSALHATARRQVASIQTAGQRLLRLINDVLDLSKIEADALQLQPEPCDVGAELAELQRLMQTRADAARVTLSLHTALGPRCLALLDRGKFGQILLNLLGNAIKFSPAGGQVLLQAQALRDGDSEQLRFSVQDQGPGIAEDELARLFQPFQQGRSGAERGGTGLGLALSRRLAERMGGRLQLRAAAGGGTEAVLELPWQSVEGAAALPSLDEHDGGWRLSSGQRCRVLVVEDDEASRDLLATWLRRLGCEVLEAEDGVDALAQAAQQDFDLVLSDMRMPRLDGPGLRERLAALPHSAAWPVVAITASSLTLTREHFLQQGFAEHLPKPYAFAALRAVMARLCGLRFEPLAQAEAEPVAGDPAQAAGATASLQQALDWAREGRALELREWLKSQPPQANGLHAPLERALAGYDLQAAENLLLAALNAADP